MFSYLWPTLYKPQILCNIFENHLLDRFLFFLQNYYQNSLSPLKLENIYFFILLKTLLQKGYNKSNLQKQTVLFKSFVIHTYFFLFQKLFDREWNSRSLISLYSVDVFDVSAQTFWSYQTFSNFSPDHPNSTNSLITNSQRMFQAKHFGQTKHFLLILPMPPILFLPILLLLILLLPILAHLPILKFSNIPILQF